MSFKSQVLTNSHHSFPKTIPHSLTKISPSTIHPLAKPTIIYDLSIINDEFEEKSQQNNEVSMVSSSSYGTINEENLRNNINHNNNNAILIRDNYYVSEEHQGKEKGKTEKKKDPCIRSITCKTKKKKKSKLKKKKLESMKISLKFYLGMRFII